MTMGNSITLFQSRDTKETWWMKLDMNTIEKKYINIIISSLKENKYFHHLEYEDFDILLSMLDIRTFTKSQILYLTHDAPDSMYIILQGKCVQIRSDHDPRSSRHRKILSKGRVVGETGMINMLPRLSSVECLTKTCMIVRLSRESYLKVLADYDHRQNCPYYYTLHNSMMFQDFPWMMVRSLEDICEIVVYPAGTVIMKQGDTISQLYVIKCGTIQESMMNMAVMVEVVIALLGVCLGFGEESMVDGVASTTITTITETECIVLYIDDINKLLVGTDVEVMKNKAHAKSLAMKRLSNQWLYNK